MAGVTTGVGAEEPNGIFRSIPTGAFGAWAGAGVGTPALLGMAAVLLSFFIPDGGSEAFKPEPDGAITEDFAAPSLVVPAPDFAAPSAA